MDKIYTADDMRKAASMLNGDVCVMNRGELSAMLRQAAEAMEREERREKKWEYGFKFKEGRKWLESTDHCSSVEELIEVAQTYYCERVRFFRREVGEWEEVRDVE